MIDEHAEILVDTVAAFIQQLYPCGPNDTELYLTFDDKLAKVCDLPLNQLYRIRRNIYGLPDSGKAYYLAYSALLEAEGYSKTKHDPCLFVRRTSTGVTYCWCHVDDTYISGTSKEEITSFLEMMKRSKFEITVKNIVDSYIGIKINKLFDGRRELTQPKCLSTLFANYNITDKPRVLTPVRPISQKPRDSSLCDATAYRSLLGGLIFLLRTRFDIAFAVSIAATKSQAPTISDMDDLQYLFQTQDKGLILEKCTPHEKLHLTCYVDASWLSHPDSRRQTGFAYPLVKQELSMQNQ